MGRELYLRCTVCGGAGRVRRAAYAGSHGKPGRIRRGADGLVECPICRGEMFVKVGVTIEDLERLVGPLHLVREPKGSVK
jgi:hypothetical protein